MNRHVPSPDDYYLQHGLGRDPFPRDRPDTLFFITPELNHRLELIRHLLEFSDQLLIVNAASGMGKTALCRYLVKNPGADWSVNPVTAAPGMTVDELVRQIVADKAGLREDAEVMLDEQLQFCLRNKKLPVIFIDAAQLLPISTLRFVIQAGCLGDAGGRWRIVLFSGPGIDAKLEDPLIKSLNMGIFHFIDIQPLNLEQATAYIHYRLSQCGNDGAVTFSERELKQIHKISAGVPGVINHLARQSMCDPSIQHQFREHPAKIAGIVAGNWGYGIAGVVLIMLFAVAGMVFVFNPTPKDGIQKQEYELPPEQATLLQRGMPDHDSAAFSKTNVEPNLLAGEKIPDAAGSATVAEKETVTAPHRDVQTDATIFPGINTREWLMQQAPEAYVLQLVGARETKTIREFLSSNKLPMEKLAWFKTQQGDKDWYVLVYGLYSSHEQAQAQIRSLDEQTKKLQPWPRRIGNIQEILRTQ